jgi:hypothetical protein
MQSRANPITIANRADGVDHQPVICIACILKKNCLSVVAVDRDIDESVVVEIAESGATAGYRD